MPEAGLGMGVMHELEQGKLERAYQEIDPQILFFQRETFPTQRPQASLVLGPPARIFPNALVGAVDELSLRRRPNLMGIGIAALRKAMPDCNPDALAPGDLGSLRFLTTLALRQALAGRDKEHLAADVSAFDSSAIQELVAQLTEKGYPEVEVRVVLPHREEELVHTLGQQVHYLQTRIRRDSEILARRFDGTGQEEQVGLDTALSEGSTEDERLSRGTPFSAIFYATSSSWLDDELPQLLAAAVQGGATRVTGVNPWGKPLFSLAIDDQARQVTNEGGIPPDLQARLDEQRSRTLSDQDRLALHHLLAKSAKQLDGVGLDELGLGVCRAMDFCRANLEQGRPLLDRFDLSDGDAILSARQVEEPSPAKLVLVAAHSALAAEDPIDAVREELRRDGRVEVMAPWSPQQRESWVAEQSERLSAYLQGGTHVIMPVVLAGPPTQPLLPPDLAELLQRLPTDGAHSPVLELRIVATSLGEQTLLAHEVLGDAVMEIQSNARIIRDYLPKKARGLEGQLTLPVQRAITAIGKIGNSLALEEERESTQDDRPLIRSPGDVAAASVQLAELYKPIESSLQDDVSQGKDDEGLAAGLLIAMGELLRKNRQAAGRIEQMLTLLQAGPEERARMEQATQLVTKEVLAEALHAGATAVAIVDSQGGLLYHTAMDKALLGLGVAFPVLAEDQKQKVVDFIADRVHEQRHRTLNPSDLVRLYEQARDLGEVLQDDRYPESVIEDVHDLHADFARQIGYSSAARRLFQCAYSDKPGNLRDESRALAEMLVNKPPRAPANSGNDPATFSDASPSGGVNELAERRTAASSTRSPVITELNVNNRDALSLLSGKPLQLVTATLAGFGDPKKSQIILVDIAKLERLGVSLPEIGKALDLGPQHSPDIPPKILSISGR